MPVHSVTLHNFKSYKGTQIIGPFTDFCAVIGPNGSGKSNLMDAISFVLGIKDNARSEKVAHLINTNCESAYVEMELRVPDPRASKMNKNDAEEALKRVLLRRSINAQGQSEYRIDHRVRTYGDYVKHLEQFNILVKARNFLVFQVI